MSDQEVPLFGRNIYTMFWRLIIDGAVQAIGQLRSNKLRTFLSLLGITIGIFCIISVKSAVSSLENNIRSSFEKLGNDVLYISKMPWAENPHANFWKYMRRPNPDHEDLQKVRNRSKLVDKSSLSVFIGRKTIKHESSSVGGAFLIGVTYDYSDILNVPYDRGRWMTPFEYQKGRNVVVLGSVIAGELFPRAEPIGKEVKIAGQKFIVIGTIEAAGDDLINPVDFDRAMLVGYETAKKVANVKSSNLFGTTLMVKAKPGVDIDEFRDEITGVLRSARKLPPKEENDFAINELSILSSILDSFFGVLNLAGIVIGVFAILVGMFSVANIMFVSVKERTGIIGVKMAMGAQRSVILWEFLVESTVICLIGGLAGLLLVYGVLAAIAALIDFEIYMSFSNAISGLVLSIVVGIISGVLPALQASRMDPVEAIRA